MKEYVGQKMIADHDNYGGGVYFYEDRLEWMPRNYRFKERSFSIPYGEIDKVNVVETFKKRINIFTKDGKIHSIDLYRVDTFLMLLDKARAEYNVVEAPVVSPTPESSDLDELARLGELHANGVLTDEEFAAMKAKIIGQ